MRYFLLFLIPVCILFFNGCKTNIRLLEKTTKVSAGNKFAGAITESQFIRVSSKEDTVVEGRNGTVIAIPKGAFMNADGDIIEDSVMIELAEAYSLDKMLLSNLTTTSGENMLETGGMLFFNVSANDGEQLQINPDKPVYIEVPAPHKEAGMMAYEGRVDIQGNMNWENPRPLENNLITVPLEELDFLPEGFAEKVEEGLPFKNHTTTTHILIDSIYYSLAVSDGSERVRGLNNTDLNEALYNTNAAVLNGKYTERSFERGNSMEDSVYSADTAESKKCGIDPARIKTIKSPEYQNSFIATREFEKRIKDLHVLHSDLLLNMYITNLDKDLWMSDSMVASFLEKNMNREGVEICIFQDSDDNDLTKTFQDYAAQKLTHVKDGDIYAILLKDFYLKKYNTIKSELEASREKMELELQTKNTQAKETIDAYKKVLWKREKFRMETYGFQWTQTGWINIDKPVVKTKEWTPAKLSINVENGSAYEQVITYIVYNDMQSIYRFNTKDKNHFYTGNDQNGVILMPDKGQSLIVSIGFSGDNIAVATATYMAGESAAIDLKLNSASKEQFATLLAPYEKFLPENSIVLDIDYQKKLFVEKKRQQTLWDEYRYIHGLWNFIFPCCAAGDILGAR